MKTLQDHIQFYREKKFSFIPITRPPNGDGKQPRVAEWMPYMTRQPLDSEVENWFRGEDSNIAVVTGGISNLVVIDLDTEEAYERIRLSAPGWADTLTVKTGKGYHLYFSIEGDSFRTFVVTFNGVHHIKCNGGYVVAPPSLHRSGRLYQFINPDATMLPIAETDIRTVLPAAGFMLQTTKPIQDRPVNFTWAHELCRDIGSGERNTRLAQLAGLLIRKMPNDPNLILGLALSWNEFYCKPPMSTEEVERTVRLEHARYFER